MSGGCQKNSLYRIAASKDPCDKRGCRRVKSRISRHFVLIAVMLFLSSQTITVKRDRGWEIRSNFQATLFSVSARMGCAAHTGWGCNLDED